MEGCAFMTDELKDIIYADLFRYTGNARRYKNIYACYLEERRSSPEFSYISVMRRTRYYADQIKKFDGFKKKLYQIKFAVTNFRLDRLSRKYHFQIPYDTEIGKGFYLAHFGGVVIGTQFRGKRKGSPHIGNYVWIGANAVIVGNIRIGNNVLIAPGAYVNFDVPDGSIVIGNPGLIRRSPGATLNYINNTILFDEYNVRSEGVKQW